MPLEEWMAAALTGTAIVAVLFFLLGSYFRLGWRSARPVADQLSPPDDRRIYTESLASFRRAGGRVWSAIFQGAWLTLLYAGVVLLAGGTVFFAATYSVSGALSVSPASWFALPRLALYAAVFTVSGLVGCALVAVVFHCRVVVRIRAGDTLAWRTLSTDFDTAMGHGGVLSSLAFGGVVAALTLGWFGVWGVAGAELARAFAWEASHGALAGLGLGALMAWPVLIAGGFMFPILAIRDPGWFSAFEAGLGLLRFRRRSVLRLGMRATALSLTVYYWPAALWMWLEYVEDQQLLVSVLLRERAPRDVLKELGEGETARSETFHEADRELNAGRYLDALNLYQILYYKNPMNESALEGVARAQLAIGNPTKGREALERLLALDPVHPEGIRLLAELQRGLWDEGGAKLEEARRRCTQKLGKGVELRDTLDPELIERVARGELPARGRPPVDPSGPSAPLRDDGPRSPL